MKWPLSYTSIRHDVTQYNDLKRRKEEDVLHRNFITLFELDPASEATRSFAEKIRKKYALGVSDAETELAEEGGRFAIATATAMRNEGFPLPNVIFVSTFKRTHQTFELFKLAWPELASVPFKEDERICEQRHGLATLYNDWRVFHVLHPEQRALYAQDGPYEYQYPQGENVPMVRARNRNFLDMIIRDHAERHVMIFTHHLNILAQRANLERLSPKEFIRIDKEEKPINCGVTLYTGDPSLGKDGKLVLTYYNKKFYK